VRDTSPQTRTILITAYGSDEVEAKARHLQAFRYFAKPFHVEDLTTAVQDALREQAGGAQSPALAVERCDWLTQRLSDLRHEIGAQYVVLADLEGQVMAAVGAAEELMPSLAALIGKGLATEFEIARQLREDRSYNLYYHEGARYDLYAATVGEQFSLIVVFDRRMGTSRIGMVWLYIKRAIQDLMIGDIAAHPGPSP